LPVCLSPPCPPSSHPDWEPFTATEGDPRNSVSFLRGLDPTLKRLGEISDPSKSGLVSDGLRQVDAHKVLSSPIWWFPLDIIQEIFIACLLNLSVTPKRLLKPYSNVENYALHAATLGLDPCCSTIGDSLSGYFTAQALSGAFDSSRQNLWTPKSDGP
jgi:hypothetical protein